MLLIIDDVTVVAVVGGGGGLVVVDSCFIGCFFVNRNELELQARVPLRHAHLETQAVRVRGNRSFDL
jgi:hypothetical protein